MITKWIDIREKSFVNAYIQVLKCRINSHKSDGGIKRATTQCFLQKKHLFCLSLNFLNILLEIILLSYYTINHIIRH